MKPKNEITAGYWLELAERYFAAETTPQEEEALRRFLASPQGNGREFDELRAVMGYLSVGRKEHRAENRRLRRPSARLRPWMYAAAAVALLLTVVVPLVQREMSGEENVCVVYVHGGRCTDTGEVMRQMHRSMQNVQPEQESVESRLSDIFQTLNTNPN